MSAIRRTDRRVNRMAQASPYSRRAMNSSAPPKKSSSWSLTGILSFFNPLRLRHTEDESVLEEPLDVDEPQEDPMEEEFAAVSRGKSPAQALSMRGHQLAQTLDTSQSSNIPPPPSTLQAQFATPKTPSHTQHPVANSPDDLRPSPAKNLETVSNFLAGKAGQPLTEVEVRGLVSLIEESVEDKDEPFRFSSTPSRGQSPNLGIFSPGISTPTLSNGNNKQTPRRTLSKNPNGPYRWQGGGSARPRNRYASPAFGPSRSAGAGIRLPLASQTPKSDSKRRRVGDEASTSSLERVPVVSVSGSSTSPTSRSPPRRVHISTSPSPPIPKSTSAPVLNGSSSQPKPNGAPSTPRPRTSVPAKPTAPVVPSPLRQAWGQSDSPPQSVSKPTKAANFMTELIKEVTPPKKVDLANPYQTASPVKPPVRKPVTRKAKKEASLKALEKERGKDQEKDKKDEEVIATPLTPQAIIEATVPKGSKRARPPADFDNSRSSAPSPSIPPPGRQRNALSTGGDSGSPVLLNQAATEEEDIHATKKQKKSPLNGNQRAPDIEEIVDVDMPPTPKLQARTLSIRPTEIIEPSDSATSPKTTQSSPLISPVSSQPTKPLFSAPKSSAPREPSKLRFSWEVEKTEASVTPPPTSTPIATPQAAITPVQEQKEKEKEKPDPKATALAMDVDTLPSYSFTFDTASSSSLAGPSHVKAREAAKALPVASLPSFDLSPPKPAAAGFNWAAAGLKAPTSAPEGNWQCGLCMLSNTAEAVEKCAFCDTPREKPKPASTSTGFNWAAASAKAPS